MEESGIFMSISHDKLVHFTISNMKAAYFSILAIALVLLSGMPVLSKGTINYANAVSVNNPLIRHIDDSDEDDSGEAIPLPSQGVVAFSLNWFCNIPGGCGIDPQDFHFKVDGPMGVNVSPKSFSGAEATKRFLDVEFSPIRSPIRFTVTVTLPPSPPDSRLITMAAGSSNCRINEPGTLIDGYVGIGHGFVGTCYLAYLYVLR
jgi:hypothetical protein